MAKNEPDSLTAHEKKLLEHFRGCMRDFESDLNAFESDLAWSGYIIDIGSKKLPLSYMVHFCFIVMLKYKHWGKDEKLAWTIPFKYKSVPLSFSLRKFGLELLKRTDEALPSGLIDEMLEKLNKGFYILDGLLQPYAAVQIELGNVTVANNFHKLELMYHFFRTKANKSFSKPIKRYICSFEKGNIRMPQDPFKSEREGFYYTAAMLDAYFSMMEHILILLLPFVDFEPTKHNIASLITSGWSTKFKNVFDLNNNKQARTLYEELNEIKEKYRNTVAHGTFEKNPVSLYFHIPTIGAMPASVSKYKESIHYTFFPIEQKHFKDICSLFDCSDKYLRNGPTKKGMLYIMSGLDVFFDEESRAMYRSNMGSLKKFREMIESLAYEDMITTNMDW